MKTLRPLVLAAAILGAVLAPSATAAESPSVLLQKAIFAEETEGNLDAAISIYQQITTEAAAQRAIAAQAQYRLALCYQKKGSKEQAVMALNDLLRQFPAEAALGQKAREILADLGQAPANQITMRQMPLSVAEGHAISRDGRFIAFSSKIRGPILIQEFATGKTWTAIADRASWIQFSPDGGRLAYYQSRKIFTAKIDGTDSKVVYTIEPRDVMLLIHDWSHDGHQLLISTWSSGKEGSLGILELATGTVRTLKVWPSSANADETWIAVAKNSPDGHLVAYWRRYAGGGNKILIVDPSNNTETAFQDKNLVELIGWLPGSSKILFISNRLGTIGLWALPVGPNQSFGEPELIKANVVVPAWGTYAVGVTRAGSLYYTEHRTFKDIYRAKVDFHSGEIIEPPRRVTERFQGQQSTPAWSKDGQALMFAAAADGGPNVSNPNGYVQTGQCRYVVVPMRAGVQREYPVWETFPARMLNYAWSPDGSCLLVNTWRAGSGLGIHSYELATGVSEMIVHTRNDLKPGTWFGHPRFATNGESFHYLRRDFLEKMENGIDYKDSIVRRHLRSGEEDIVYRSPTVLQVFWPFELSPDGSRLALLVEEKVNDTQETVALKVHDLRSGDTRQLARTAPGQEFSSVVWTPDGKRLLYTTADHVSNRDASGPDPSFIWSIAVEGGAPVQIKFDLPDIRDIALHPDGRQIAFRAGPGGKTSLWVLEGLSTKPFPPTAGTAGN